MTMRMFGAGLVALLAGCAEGRRSAVALAAGDAPSPATASAEPDAPPVVRPASGLPVPELTVVPGPVLAHARYHHTATLLADGDVLVVGGEARPGEPIAIAERFDPVAAAWRPAGLLGPPDTARTRHTATRLLGGGPSAGLVLVAGGQTGGTALDSAELYDPVADRFRLPAGRLATARAGHTATALPDGRVLLVGGADERGEPLASGELFDPATGTFSAIPGAWLATGRAYHAATLLADGRVLVTGGVVSAAGRPPVATGSAELLVPAAPGEPWVAVTVAVPMVGPRAAHTATPVLLADGREVVLLTGGSTYAPEPRARADAEVFDPSAFGEGGFAALWATMATPRSGHSATAMADGRTVLVIGGATAPHPELCPVTVGLERFVPHALGEAAPGTPYGGLSSTALFVQPVSPEGTPVGLPETAQGLTAHGAVRLADGRVLVVGGADCAFAAPVAVARVAIAGETER